MPVGVFSNPSAIERSCQAIAKDRRRGARELALAALRCLARARPAAVASEEYWQGVLALARILAKSRPAMASLGGVVAELLLRVDAGAQPATSAGELHCLLAQEERGLREALLQLPETTARRMAEDLGKLGLPLPRRPITLSYSSTVVAVVGVLGRGGAEVTVCESRPLLEGRKTARALAPRVRMVRLITEAQIPAFISRCDYVLLGCDRILPEGSVVNKVGSKLLALCAGKAGVPVVVVGDTFKVGEGFDAEEHDAAEVWPRPPRGVEVANPYFEVVEAQLLDFIATEAGLCRPDGVGRWGGRVQAARELLFPPGNPGPRRGER